MDWRAAFKGSFISAVEFGGKEPTLTISQIKVVQVDDEKTKKPKAKLVVYFRETDRGWIPCKTNAMCCAGMFGSNETDTWIGKRLTLYSTKVNFGAEKVDGIRVKGSPDLSAPIEVLIKLPKKKPTKMRLVPTGKAGAKTEAAEGEPAEQDAAAALADAAEEASGPDHVEGFDA